MRFENRWIDSIGNSGVEEDRRGGQQQGDRKRLNGTCLRRAAPSSPRSEEWHPSCSSSIPTFRPLSRQHPVCQTRSKYTPNNFPIPSLRIPSWFHTSSSFRRSLILSTHFLSSLTTRISDHLWGTLSFTIYNNPPCLTVGPRGCYTN